MKAAKQNSNALEFSSLRRLELIIEGVRVRRFDFVVTRPKSFVTLEGIAT